MEDNKINKSIEYFFQGKLSPENERNLLDWIKLSEENRAFFLKEQEMLEDSQAFRRDKIIDSDWESLKKRLSPDKKQKGKIILIQVASIAATFVLGILLTIAVINRYYSEPEQTVQIQNITVPIGAKTKFTLPDSSLVWLNSGSELSFPTVFGENRQVALTGEAFFEVVKNGSRFIVSTNYGEVEVMGTSFDVKAFEDDDFETTLVTGTVKVTQINNINGITLRSGQQAVLENNQLKRREVNTELFTSWKEGKLMFEREPFPSLMRKLERWYNVKIDYTDPGLTDLWYTGTIEMETISEVMEMVSKAAHVSYSFDRKTRIITIRSNQR
jgi:transmembrane sensor